MLHAVIMAGGAGTRFWPASRLAKPKQLLRLVDQRSMIQATVERLGDLVTPDRVLVVTNQLLVEPIREQLPSVPAEAIIGEPCKRDTAPCIGLASSIVSRHDDDAIMLVMPADHVIRPPEAFQDAVRQAVALVQEQPTRIVTFGIRPTYPAETFGYIERAKPIDSPASQGGKVSRVMMFREKPSAEVAEQYLAAGNFYWNSGIFVWKASTIWNAMKQFEPEMAGHLENIAATLGTEAFPQTFADEFAAIQGKSIDYAVMEHYDDVVVVEAPFHWDDVGNWRSLVRLRGADDQGNTVVGKHLGIDTRGCIVRSEDDHLIVTVGMEDCIVVHTPDATLVARKHDEESIRKVVEELRQRGWEGFL